MIMTFIAVGTESIKNFVFHSLIKNVDMMIIRSNQFYFYSLKSQSLPQWAYDHYRDNVLCP